MNEYQEKLNREVENQMKDFKAAFNAYRIWLTNQNFVLRKVWTSQSFR